MADDLTVHEFIDSLRPGWKLDDWLCWPPDVFAFTSLLLKSTGAYRHTVSPPGQPWPEVPNWSRMVEDSAGEWRKWMTGGKKKPPRLKTNCAHLKAVWDKVSLADLRAVCGTTAEDDTSWNVCRILLELHALADETCRGFGLPSGAYWKEGTDISAMRAIEYFANMMLTLRGTLSRLPKHKVVVLPKMRTPQVGLTLRSLSHHLTAHQSEVNVRWRSIPWINSDENTLNILVVPWPPVMEVSWFKQASHFVNRNSSEPCRYFAYSKDGQPLPVARVVELVKNARSYVNRIHLLVFPELALSPAEFDELKNMLAREMPRDAVPMIVSGLGFDATSGDGSRLGRNRVVLSTFFAGKWYDLEQDKHHRWKLDDNQIQQYNLGGVLTGRKDWWEAIEVRERDLTLLAPNGWLALCPLICEDLARLEPVSEMIRGIGPTLLIAILLDGPQIRERWPGRYVSVLAEDPGTAVLTVSALGMTELSKPTTRKRVRRAVALWKDQTTWQEIELAQDHDAVILTITASWREEFAADGRGDGCNAAAFQLQGTRGLKFPQESGNGEQAESPSRDQNSFSPSQYVSNKPHDIEELGTFAYLVDAVIDSNEDMIDNLQRWAVGRKSDTKDWLETNFRPGASLFELIHKEIEKGYSQIQNPSEKRREFELFIEWFCQTIRAVDRGKDVMDYWSRLVEVAAKILAEATADEALAKIAVAEEAERERVRDEEQKKLRVRIYSALSILWAVHKRASDGRDAGLTAKSVRLLDRIERILPKPYDHEWYRILESGSNG